MYVLQCHNSKGYAIKQNYNNEGVLAYLNYAQYFNVSIKFS